MSRLPSLEEEDGPVNIPHVLRHTPSYSSMASVDENGRCTTCQSTTTREEILRLKLRYYFMNPIDKFKTKRKFPWKLVLQVLKIILVTLQLAMFGLARSSHVNFLEKSNLAFRHLFLKNWDPSYETMPYPPATGQYAIYTIPDFYEYINFALNRYHDTERIAIGVYMFDNANNTQPPMQFCKTFYKTGKIFAYNQTYLYDSTQVTECVDVYPVYQYNQTTESWQNVYDIRAFLNSSNMSINFDRLISATLKVSLSTIHLKTLSRLDMPDCYIFNITILFDNTPHNGQVLITLKSWEQSLECQGSITYTSSDNITDGLSTTLDSFVILISIMSLVLCCRSIFRAQILRKETIKYFKKNMKKEEQLDRWTQLEFVNLWYVMIVTNDVLTVVGSILKIAIENKMMHNYEWAGILLGVGNLFIWLGVLRYLGFFKSYNILIITMKTAAPNVIRFLVCASVFYFGFTVCGWVVLGPYHVKFRQLSTASECLFSLVNGDDMFVTFSVITTDKTSTYIWWFSRIYLYTFVSLFIYVVLNLFIAVILDTYEVIKEYNKNGFPKNVLHEFVDKGIKEEDEQKLASFQVHRISWLPCSCLPCCHDTREVQINEDGDERTPLLIT